jgi:hypothetical protein
MASGGKKMYICIYDGPDRGERGDKQLVRYPLTPDIALYLQIPHKGLPQASIITLQENSMLVPLPRPSFIKKLRELPLMHHPRAAN